MAFTRQWDEDAPDGASLDARELDNEIRNLKVDIRERMEQIVSDWESDPLAGVDNKARTVHWTEGSPDRHDSEWDVTGGAVHPSSVGVATIWLVPITLGGLCSLIAISADVYRGSTSVITLKVFKWNNDTGATSQLGSTATAAATDDWEQLSVATTETISTNGYYFAEITMTAATAATNAKLAGIIISFNRNLLSNA